MDRAELLSQLSRLASRPGYRITQTVVDCSIDGRTTHYLWSHKNRVVGAVCCCDDGATVTPCTPWEAADWYAYDG